LLHVFQGKGKQTQLNIGCVNTNHPLFFWLVAFCTQHLCTMIGGKSQVIFSLIHHVYKTNMLYSTD